MSIDVKLVRWPDRDRDDFHRLTNALARVRDAVIRGGGDLMSPVVPTGPEEASDLDRARALLNQDAARREAAGANADLFADPAWHALLTLFVAGEEGHEVAAASLKSAMGALPGAAARWLALVEQRGLIALSGELDKDPVRLTAAGETFVSACLRAL